MKKIYLLLWLAMAGTQAQAQPAGLVNAEQKSFENAHTLRAGRAINNYDLKYYRLEWTVDPAINHIAGKVSPRFMPLTGIAQMQFDLSLALTVDSVLYHGSPLAFAQLTGDILQLNFGVTLPAATLDSVNIYYHGVPPNTGLGSFIQSTHGSYPIMWTLSEPYGARDWWPCKQDLQDKIDSLDIFITHPAQYRAASNGVLKSEITTGSTTRTHWQHRYPIATYLICMAVTNYAVYSHYAPYGANTVEIVNYVYPEDSLASVPATAVTVRQMQLFDTLFGIYPFYEEKYGHAQFGWGGGMEHQTMTFVGNFAYELLAHELAHHWFGDKVTCGSWQHVWINEGFATYLSGLCYERLEPFYWNGWKQGVINNITSQPDGSVFCADTLNINRLFDSRLTYAKGAMILHTLRWVMGDPSFYAGVNAYLNDKAFGFSKMEGFKQNMEAAYGSDLTWYFNDWYYGEGFPSYTVRWGLPAANTVSITLDQAQSHPSVPFYALPVPIRFKNSIHDTVVVLDHTFSGQTFTLPLAFTPDSAFFDPEHWIISNNNTVVSVAEAPLVQPASVYPSVTTSTVNILMNPQANGQAHIRVLSAEGKCVLQKDIYASSVLDISALQSGMYFVHIQSGQLNGVQKVIKQ